MGTTRSRFIRPFAVMIGMTVLAGTLTGCIITPEAVQELKRVSDESRISQQDSGYGEEPAADGQDLEPMVVATNTNGEEWGFSPQGTLEQVEDISSGSWEGNLVGLVVDVARLAGQSGTSHTSFTFALKGDDGELYDPGTAAEVVAYNDYYALEFPRAGDVVKDATVIVQIPEQVVPASWVLLDDQGDVIQEFHL